MWVFKANIRGRRGADGGPGPQGLNASETLPADDAVAGYLGTAGSSATKTAFFDNIAGAAFGLALPTAVTYTAIQAAAVAAKATGRRLWAAGTITTDQTLTVNCDFDLGGLTINYVGIGNAVVLGDLAGPAHRISGTLPRVIAADKTVPGWAEVAGTVGVFAVNLDSSSKIVVPFVSNFETGLYVYGKGAGAAYSTFLIGHLDNNKVNLKLGADATGWVNQNTFIGGRYGHNSEEGLNVSGVRHILMTAGLANPVNNNLWLNPSVEFGAAEFHVDFAGTANMILNGRWESTPPRIRFQANATGNQVLYGYLSQNIVVTHMAGAAGNHVFTQSRFTRPADGPAVLENTASSGSAVDVVLGAGATASGADITSAYTVFRSALKTGMKRASDAFDRLRLDHSNGRLYLGTGALDPTMYVGNAAGLLDLEGMTVGTTAPAAGGAGALPATPKGYLSVFLNGGVQQIPYY